MTGGRRACYTFCMTVTEALSQRRSRFVPADEAPSFLITPRDVEIIRQVARHRFLSSTHISDLLAAPHKKIGDRLTFLFHGKYLDRPRGQRERYRDGGGSERMVYALANRGAQLLIEQDGYGKADIDWTRKNREVTHRFIQHTLAIADVRVGLVRAVRSRSGLELLEPQQLLAAMPATTQTMRNPWAWRANVQHNNASKEVGLVPDYAFGIVFPDGKRRCCLVECDRGTMPIDRSNLEQTSMLKKFLGYTAGKRAKLHQRQFDWKAFRVLIITNTPERVANLLTAVRERVHADGHDLFLVTDRTSLATADILAHQWRDARGKAHSLV